MGQTGKMYCGQVGKINKRKDVLGNQRSRWVYHSSSSHSSSSPSSHSSSSSMKIILFFHLTSRLFELTLLWRGLKVIIRQMTYITVALNGAAGVFAAVLL